MVQRGFMLKIRTLIIALFGSRNCFEQIALKPHVGLFAFRYPFLASLNLLSTKLQAADL